jgi:DNA-binding transcriptional ArsR family regulator
LLTEMSSLTTALWWSTMTDSAVLRERIIDHGRRDAHERIAHLFYEMLIRYRMVGQAEDDRLPFPLTQEDLADATGLTPVHVNRTLKQLREEGLVELQGKMLTIMDAPGLKRVARFNPNYLHLRKAEQRIGGGRQGPASGLRARPSCSHRSARVIAKYPIHVKSPASGCGIYRSTSRRGTRPWRATITNISAAGPPKSWRLPTGPAAKRPPPRTSSSPAATPPLWPSLDGISAPVG